MILFESGKKVFELDGQRINNAIKNNNYKFDSLAQPRDPDAILFTSATYSLFSQKIDKSELANKSIYLLDNTCLSDKMKQFTKFKTTKNFEKADCFIIDSIPDFHDDHDMIFLEHARYIILIRREDVKSFSKEKLDTFIDSCCKANKWIRWEDNFHWADLGDISSLYCIYNWNAHLPLIEAAEVDMYINENLPKLKDDEESNIKGMLESPDKDIVYTGLKLLATSNYNNCSNLKPSLTKAAKNFNSTEEPLIKRMLITLGCYA